MRRFLTIAMASLLTLSLLAGCGGGARSGQGGTGTDESGAVIQAPEIEAIRQRGVLRAGVKVDVPKFGYKDPQTGQIDGFEVDIVRAIAREILGDESKIELHPVNAKTRGPALDNDEVDVVVATFTITEDRRRSFNFSEPYFQDFVGLLVKKDGPKSWKELDGKRIGVAQAATTKSALAEAAQKDGIRVEFREFATYPEIKAALDAGQVDAFAVDVAILLGYLDDSTVILEERFAPQDYGVATKKANTGLAAVVNDVIVRMKESGEIDRLLAKWELKY
ncbi:MAG TPA: transporter substrate-binding domain-containing protein [Symbiobacteriaceae bacterium]